MWWFSPAQEQALVVESLFAQWCGMTICDWPVHQKKNSSVILLFLHRAMGEEISEWLFVCVKILTPQLSCLRCVLSRVELFLSTTCTSFSESPQLLQWHIKHCHNHTDLASSRRGPAKLWLSSFLQTPAQLSRTACHLSKAACSWRSENTFTNAPYSSNKLKGEKGSNDVLVRIFSWCVFSQGPLFC